MLTKISCRPSLVTVDELRRRPTLGRNFAAGGHRHDGVRLLERRRPYPGDRRHGLLFADAIAGGRFPATAERVHRTVGTEATRRNGRAAAQAVVEL